MMPAGPRGRDRTPRYSHRMGRIADAAVDLLADGPLGADALGAALAAAGATRSRNPAEAARRAIRADPRVIQLVNGRLASAAQALEGLELTTVLGELDVASGRIDVAPDLAPLALIGIGPRIAVPEALAAGDVVAVRLEDAVGAADPRRGHRRRPAAAAGRAGVDRGGRRAPRAARRAPHGAADRRPRDPRRLHRRRRAGPAARARPPALGGAHRRRVRGSPRVGRGPRHLVVAPHRGRDRHARGRGRQRSSRRSASPTPPRPRSG